MPGSSSWVPCAAQGVKGLDDDDDYQHLPTCFSAQCAILRQNFIICSKLLLPCLITDLTLYYIYIYIYMGL